MKTFIYNVYDSIAEEDYTDEIVAESIDDAEEIMNNRYNMHYFWKIIEVLDI